MIFPKKNQSCLVLWPLGDKEVAGIWFEKGAVKSVYETRDLDTLNLPVGMPVYFLIPAESINQYPLELPEIRNRKQRLSATRFVLEENMSMQLDDMYLLVHPGSKKGHYIASLANKEKVEGWRPYWDRWPLTKAIPEQLALAYLPECWTFYATKKRVLVRTAPGQGFAAAPELIAHLLSKTSPHPKRLIFYGEHKVCNMLMKACKFLGEDVSKEYHPDSEDPMQWLNTNDQLEKVPAITRTGWFHRMYLKPMVVFCCFLVLSLSLGVEAYFYQRNSSLLKQSQKIIEEYTSSVLRDNPNIDPISELRSQVSRLRAEQNQYFWRASNLLLIASMAFPKSNEYQIEEINGKSKRIVLKLMTNNMDLIENQLQKSNQKWSQVTTKVLDQEKDGESTTVTIEFSLKT